MNSSKIVLPSMLYPTIFDYFHTSEIGAHLGYKKTLNKIREQFTYNKMATDIKIRYKNCVICAQTKAYTSNNKHVLQSQVEANFPMHKINIDLAGPFPRSVESGAQYLLICLDAFSKFIIAKPINKATTINVINALKRHVFHHFGIPKIIVSDRAAIFKSQAYKNFCFSLGINLFFECSLCTNGK